MRRDSMATEGGGSGSGEGNGVSFAGVDTREGGQKRRFGRLGRRRLALALCGWDINNTELRADIAR